MLSAEMLSQNYFNLHQSIAEFSRRQIDNFFTYFLENNLWHFMQIVSLGECL